MGREIRFRAWNKKTKQISEPFNIQDIWADNYTGESWLVLGDKRNTFESWDDLILMQYTGLKDKNGKEIYDGYICKYSPHPKDVVVINFDEELLTCKATVVSDGVYCEDYFFIKSDSPKYEVIGNIYETPELLTKS